MDAFTKQLQDIAIVLAAGSGTRLKSSTPKVLHKIGGLAMVDHVIKNAKATNAEIVAVVNPAHQVMIEDNNSIFARCNKVLMAYQKTPRGSGNAVRCALNAMSYTKKKRSMDVPINCNTSISDIYGWVYVLYADIPLVSPDTLLALKKVALTCPKTALVVLAMDAKKSKNLGRLEAAAEPGTVKRIVEESDIQHSGKHNTNGEGEHASDIDDVQQPNFLDLCNCGLLIRFDVLAEMVKKICCSSVTGEFYITEIVQLIHDAGFVCRYYEGPVEELSGANTMEELAVLEGYFQQQMRKKHMGNGVRLVSPETVFFSHDTEIEPDVIVHPYVVFMEGVKIKSGSSVNSFCTLQGTLVNCSSIGPFARLRPGTEIEANVSVGNFVEIKNSLISERSKINHLSYVGDSFVGSETNIGAGTITCNYNGFAKYRTTIGNNVFVGSNSSIVAPIQIGNNAIIAAGSTVTDEVLAGDLVFARAPQENVKNGAMIFRNKKKKI
ncbi:MAG: NTP transferase domain-containing protein [Holosporaceae bacterium]|jgi:bifunctional UDP-N-acetylglucosamine pyrophosphorylase/glucosamine-1-phosphate N-acetyltransferase|nr:NTP transferase domain-containing protein [Holosporaceae bacterium]